MQRRYTTSKYLKGQWDPPLVKKMSTVSNCVLKVIWNPPLVLNCILAPQSCFTFPPVGRLWPSLSEKMNGWRRRFCSCSKRGIPLTWNLKAVRYQCNQNGRNIQDISATIVKNLLAIIPIGGQKEISWIASPLFFRETWGWPWWGIFIGNRARIAHAIPIYL